MIVIHEERLARHWRKHRDAKAWLENWLAVARQAQWRTIQDVRADFPAADGGVKVKSGADVTVFNVSGNNHRLAVFISFAMQRITILDAMTHGEYSKDFWKQRW